MSTTRYTIRPAGKAAWGTTDDKREAVRLYRKARDRMSREHIIIYDEIAAIEVSPDELVPPKQPTAR